MSVERNDLTRSNWQMELLFHANILSWNTHFVLHVIYFEFITVDFLRSNSAFAST